MIRRRLFLVLFGGLVISLFQAYCNIIDYNYYGLSYPFSTSLFIPKWRFSDFYFHYFHGCLIRRGGNPYTAYGDYKAVGEVLADRYPQKLGELPQYLRGAVSRQIYFPLANWAGYFFSCFRPSTALQYYFILVLLGNLSALVWQSEKFVQAPDRLFFRVVAVPLLLLSYPFLFMLDRGNWEGILSALCWFYVLLYKEKSSLAWIPLSIVGAIKPQLLVLSGLPVLDRDYRLFAKILGAAALLCLASLAALPGSFDASWRGLWEGVRYFHNSQLNELAYIRFHHTLARVMEGISWQNRPHYLGRESLLMSAKIVGLFAALEVLLFLWKSKARLSLEYRILALVVTGITFVPVSIDYTLIELFPVYFFLLGDLLTAARFSDRKLLVFALLTALLAPKHFFGAYIFCPAYIINPALLVGVLFIPW